MKKLIPIIILLLGVFSCVNHQNDDLIPELLEGQTEKSEIVGTFDFKTKTLTFNNARRPPEILEHYCTLKPPGNSTQNWYIYTDGTDYWLIDPDGNVTVIDQSNADTHCEDAV